MKGEKTFVLQDLKQRTMSYALRIIRLYSALPKSVEGQVIGRQFLRSGTSVGAHYREACRARSSAEFISKIEGGLQELEETAYWCELLEESHIIAAKRLADLKTETHELTAILTACVLNAKKRRLADSPTKRKPLTPNS